MPENNPDPRHQSNGQSHGQSKGQPSGRSQHHPRRPRPRSASVRPLHPKSRHPRAAESQRGQTRPRPVRGFADAHGWEIADLVAVGVMDAVSGQPPVPISVWRATGPDEPPTTPGHLFTGLTPRVAAILLAIYTDPGDLVMDATGDVVVEGAAGAGGRLYRRFGAADGHTGLPAGPAIGSGKGTAGSGVASSRFDGVADLVLLRWPPFSDAPRREHGQEDRQLDEQENEQAVVQPEPELLRMCTRLLAPDGHTVAILAPPAGGIYRDYTRTLIEAAAHAGLGYLQHIVVITGYPDDNAAVGRDSHQAGGDSGDGVGSDGLDDGFVASDGEEAHRHLDLLVLVLSPGRTAEPSSGPARREPR